jgi:hypothetical protein
MAAGKFTRSLLAELLWVVKLQSILVIIIVPDYQLLTKFATYTICRY